MTRSPRTALVLLVACLLLVAGAAREHSPDETRPVVHTAHR